MQEWIETEAMVPMMAAAAAHTCRLLPLLEDQSGYNEAMGTADNRTKKDFYASKLNRANRVPANGCFSEG